MNELRQNLSLQNRKFRQHEAGEYSSAYAELDRQMRAMCKTRQCYIQPEKGFVKTQLAENRTREAKKTLAEQKLAKKMA